MDKLGNTTESDDKSSHAFHAYFLASSLLIIFFIWLLFLAQSNYPLIGDEAQYWFWSKYPDFGYFSKPPVVAWAIAVSTWIGGDAEFFVRLPSPIAYLISSIFIYLAAKKLFDSKTAVISSIIFATLPAVSYSASLVTTDPFLLMFWAIGLYWFILILDNPSSISKWLILGVICGLGMLAKYNFAFFFLSIGIYILASKDRLFYLKSLNPYLCGLVALLVFSPNIVWNIQNGFASFVHVAEDNAQVLGEKFNLLNTLTFFGSQFAVFGPILFSLFIYALYKFVRSLRVKRESLVQNPEFLLWCFALPILFIFLFLSFITKSDPHWASPTYIAASIIAARYIVKNSLYRILLASVLLHIVALGIFHNYDQIRYSLASKYHELKLPDPFVRTRGWREVGAEVTMLQKKYPDAVIVTTERKQTAQFLYYAELKKSERAPYGFIKWNKDKYIDDHFEMISKFKESDNGRFIIISDSKDNSEIIDSFKNIAKLEPIERNLGGNRKSGFQIYLANGFSANMNSKR